MTSKLKLTSKLKGAIAGAFVGVTCAAAVVPAEAATQWTWAFDNPGSFCCSGRPTGTLVTDGTLDRAKSGPFPATFAITDFTVDPAHRILHDTYSVAPGAGFTWDGAAPTAFFDGQGNDISGFDSAERLPDPATGEPIPDVPAFSIFFQVAGGEPLGFGDVNDAFSAEGGRLDLTPIPIPGALPLFASALAAFGLARRRKQADV